MLNDERLRLAAKYYAYGRLDAVSNDFSGSNIIASDFVICYMNRYNGEPGLSVYEAWTDYIAELNKL